MALNLSLLVYCYRLDTFACPHPKKEKRLKYIKIKPHLTGQVLSAPPSPAHVTLRYSKNLFGLSVWQVLLPSLSASDRLAHIYTLSLLFKHTASPLSSSSSFLSVLVLEIGGVSFSQGTFNSFSVCDASLFLSLGQSMRFPDTEDF